MMLKGVCLFVTAFVYCFPPKASSAAAPSFDEGKCERARACVGCVVSETAGFGVGWMLFVVGGFVVGVRSTCMRILCASCACASV